MSILLFEEFPALAKLKLDRKFQPCSAEPDDELYPNGIFVFNITRLLGFIEAHAERFPIDAVAIAEIPDYGGGADLNSEWVQAADLTRPIFFAEISPGRYNLIDGHHRVAKARREGLRTLPARQLRCPQHVPFLATTMGYEKYVEYWNEKLKALKDSRLRAARASAAFSDMRASSGKRAGGPDRSARCFRRHRRA